MKIREHIDGESLTLFLEGDFDETNCSSVEAKFDEALDGEAKNIFINMKRVKYISSFGIRVLILAHKKAVKLGKRVVLSEMSEKVREIVEMVGILPLFAASGSDR